MAEKKADTVATKNPKKANLLDHHSIKHILDESVSEVKPSRKTLILDPWSNSSFLIYFLIF